MGLVINKIIIFIYQIITGKCTYTSNKPEIYIRMSVYIFLLYVEGTDLEPLDPNNVDYSLSSV